MEVEEQATPPVEEKTEESSSAKAKILTLLNPSDVKETKKDKNKPPTKVVVRRLPPRLTKEAFLEEFSPLPAHDYFYFVKGDLNLGIHAFARAYINFSKQEDIFAFKEKYDDYGMTDEKGRTYHAVVEFAPFQRVPRRNTIKKKSSKAGTLESDPKYIEFLKKLEEEKNNLTNTSEYFHETEAATVKEKITTTPLLEFLKQKKQKKIDLRNEIRQKKREAERERKRKEDERRKAERERRKDDRDRKSSRYDDKSRGSDSRKSDDKKLEDKDRSKEEKKDLTEIGEGASNTKQSDAVIPNDPAILKVVLRQPEKENEKPKKASSSKEDVKVSDSKPERKYSDFRTRLAEEKQRKTFYKNKVDIVRTNRKGMPDEKGDKASVGNNAESVRKTGSVTEVPKKPIEPKSKFRYSEQRNREREFRNQKNSDLKKTQEATTKTQGEKQENTRKSPRKEFQPRSSENISRSSRRKSLELEREIVDGDRKRSKSLHDSSDNDDIKSGKDKSNNQDENSQPSDGSKDSNGSDETKKYPRMERRIRNKDRPSIEIYRPGMGKFSKQRLEHKKDDTNNVSPPGTLNKSKNKSSNKTSAVKNEESFNKNKTASEVRSMTFTRSTSKEN